MWSTRCSPDALAVWKDSTHEGIGSDLAFFGMATGQEVAELRSVGKLEPQDRPRAACRPRRKRNAARLQDRLPKPP